jgi:uncharacterized protein with PIN domain
MCTHPQQTLAIGQRKEPRRAIQIRNCFGLCQHNDNQIRIKRPDARQQIRKASSVDIRRKIRDDDMRCSSCKRRLSKRLADMQNKWRHGASQRVWLHPQVWVSANQERVRRGFGVEHCC